jgi:hypothetical protein
VQQRDEGRGQQDVGHDKSNGEAVSVYEWAADTARNNPMLVVGGAVAIGAIAVLALSRREPPQSNVQLLERRLRRQLVSAEKALKQSVKDIRRSDFGSGLGEFSGAVASRLGSLDTSQLEALAHSARRMLDHVAARVSSAVR